MVRLYELGLNDKEIIEMITICNEIEDLSDEQINNKIIILKQIGCTDKQIRNILISNPNYLDRLDDDILLLINRLDGLGFKCLNILIDSNPNILNKDVFEIDNYINELKEDGEDIEDIVDELDFKPYIFDEM